MRQVLEFGTMDPQHLYWALFLNAIYMTLAAIAFKFFFDDARRHGFLAKYAA